MNPLPDVRYSLPYKTERAFMGDRILEGAAETFVRDSRRYLLFDLDDTLIPSTRLYAEAYAALNVDSDRLELAKKEVKSRLPTAAPSAHNRILYFKRYLELAHKFTARQTLELVAEYELRLEESIGKAWRHLLRDRLMTSLTRQYNLAILTNETTRMQLIKMRAIDVDANYFRFVLTSEEIGSEKPDQAAFSAAIASTGCQPRDICFVGDSFANDVRPAVELGMTAIGSKEFRDESAMAPSAPWLNRLDDLPALLAGIHF